MFRPYIDPKMTNKEPEIVPGYIMCPSCRGAILIEKLGPAKCVICSEEMYVGILISRYGKKVPLETDTVS
jgi:hypothetical protein